jgi:hypothetical protein
MSPQMLFNFVLRLASAQTAKPFMCNNFKQQYDNKRRIQASVGNIWTVGWIPKIGTSSTRNRIVAGDLLCT